MFFSLILCCSFLFLLLHSFIYLHHIKFMTVYWTGMVIFHNAPLMAALNAERGKVKNEQFNSLFLHLNFFSLSNFSTQLSPSLPETTGAERQIWQTHVLPNFHMTLCFLLPGHRSSCCQRPHTLGDTWLKKNILAIYCPVLRVLSNAVHF